MTTAIDLTGVYTEIEALSALAQKQGCVDVSELTALDASRALNAGIDPGTIKEVLIFVTIVFQTGSAALAFLKSAREEMRARQSSIQISDAASGQALCTVKSSTSDIELEQVVRK